MISALAFTLSNYAFAPMYAMYVKNNCDARTFISSLRNPFEAYVETPQTPIMAEINTIDTDLKEGSYEGEVICVYKDTDAQGEAFLAEVQARVAEFNDIKKIIDPDSDDYYENIKKMLDIVNFLGQGCKDDNIHFVNLKREKPDDFRKVDDLFRRLTKEYKLVVEVQEENSPIGFYSLAQYMELKPCEKRFMDIDKKMDHIVEYIQDCRQMIRTLSRSRSSFNIFESRVKASFEYIENWLDGMGFAKEYKDFKPYNLFKQEYDALEKEIVE